MLWVLDSSGEIRPWSFPPQGPGESRELPAFGECVGIRALDASGDVVVTGDVEGKLRVGRLTGGEPHLLVGHWKEARSASYAFWIVRRSTRTLSHDHQNRS